MSPPEIGSPTADKVIPPADPAPPPPSNPSNQPQSAMSPPEIGSPTADKVIPPADPDPAGEITAELKAGSLRKRGRSDKSSVVEATNIPPTRFSLRKRDKPAPEGSPACPSSAAPPQRSAAKKSAKDQVARKTAVASSSSSKGKGVMVEEDPEDVPMAEDDDEEVGDALLFGESTTPIKRKEGTRVNAAEEPDALFVGDPIPDEEAEKRWPDRYTNKEAGNSRSRKPVSIDPDDVGAKRHYMQAMVDDVLYHLYDDVYVKALEGEDDYIGRIVELFEGSDSRFHFTAQWFYRTVDTIVQKASKNLEPRRVFLSEDKNVNDLDCIVSKLSIVKVDPNIDLDAKMKALPKCDLYFDMSYSLAYTSFANLPPGNNFKSGEALPSLYPADSTSQLNQTASSTTPKAEFTLLDLYSGCGAMSTGLCLGAKISNINLVTKWAVDINKFACEGLKMNHPETEVRQENAEHYLELLRAWEKMCRKYKLFGSDWSSGQGGGSSESDDDMEDAEKDDGDDDEAFEVGKIVGICFGDPQKNDKVGLYYQVRRKGYGPSHDTWEPAEGLSNCKERIESFIRSGFQKRILPLPGMVDVICGGPPCQGISGFNRFRKADNPLSDPKNKQMHVFTDIVEFLKPKHILMENVVDLLKFSEGYLGRYALGRLVEMNYQASLGIMAAGCYGLPQFRMRCFIWGAHPTEKLPQFPLPSHDVVVRGGIPRKFESNLVAYNENERPALERLLVLEDAISDLPPVGNSETRDEMAYGRSAITDFQRFIRLTKDEFFGSASTGDKSNSRGKLYDHRPLNLNDDDYQRVCQIPKRKGACFRDLPGVIVGPNNVVEFDPDVERVYLPSGKPLVPDYAMTFVDGKSPKPFGRLWWDVTVPTVVTRAEPHNQIILHPMQDRVLTIRENARLQGFPDFYRFYGPVKQRYMQVGNAVAVPVSRALGYSLGLAYWHQGSNSPVFRLPPSFPQHAAAQNVSPVAVESVCEG